jgi:hypothetical protein
MFISREFWNVVSFTLNGAYEKTLMEGMFGSIREEIRGREGKLPKENV